MSTTSCCCCEAKTILMSFFVAVLILFHYNALSFFGVHDLTINTSYNLYLLFLVMFDGMVDKLFLYTCWFVFAACIPDVVGIWPIIYVIVFVSTYFLFFLFVDDGVHSFSSRRQFVSIVFLSMTGAIICGFIGSILVSKIPSFAYLFFCFSPSVGHILIDVPSYGFSYLEDLYFDIRIILLRRELHNLNMHVQQIMEQM